MSLRLPLRVPAAICLPLVTPEPHHYREGVLHVPVQRSVLSVDTRSILSFRTSHRAQRGRQRHNEAGKWRVSMDKVRLPHIVYAFPFICIDKCTCSISSCFLRLLVRTTHEPSLRHENTHMNSCLRGWQVVSHFMRHYASPCPFDGSTTEDQDKLFHTTFGPLTLLPTSGYIPFRVPNMVCATRHGCTRTVLKFSGQLLGPVPPRATHTQSVSYAYRAIPIPQNEHHH